MPVLPRQRFIVILKSIDNSDLGWKVEFTERGKAENPQKNPRVAIEMRLRSTNPSPRAGRSSRSQAVEVGGANDDHYANLTLPMLINVPYF